MRSANEVPSSDVWLKNPSLAIASRWASDERSRPVARVIGRTPSASRTLVDLGGNRSFERVARDRPGRGGHDAERQQGSEAEHCHGGANDVHASHHYAGGGSAPPHGRPSIRTRAIVPAPERGSRAGGSGSATMVRLAPGPHCGMGPSAPIAGLASISAVAARPGRLSLLGFYTGVRAAPMTQRARIA